MEVALNTRNAIDLFRRFFTSSDEIAILDCIVYSNCVITRSVGMLHKSDTVEQITFNAGESKYHIENGDGTQLGFVQLSEVMLSEL